MAVAAEQCVLAAAKVANWQAAGGAFDRATATAAELDDALADVAELYRRLERELLDGIIAIDAGSEPLLHAPGPPPNGLRGYPGPSSPAK